MTAPYFVQYVPKGFRVGALAIIDAANAMLEDYAEQGYDLTLRQLYYQFVARGFIANRDTEYKRLGGIISDARLAGVVPWNRIVDRTRNLRGTYHVDDVEQAVREAARDFAVDLWEDQPVRCEVWVEKDALIGVVQQAAGALDVNHFSCRGYTSQSELWNAAMRHVRYVQGGQRVVVIHLGDHDPSGIDMTRDIQDRLILFAGRHLSARQMWPDDDEDGAITVKRIALNRNQVERYNPPPNPAKLTDSRARGYVLAHGYESWELDALEPTVLAELIREAIVAEMDEPLYKAAVEEQEERRTLLQLASDQWDELTVVLEDYR